MPVLGWIVLFTALGGIASAAFASVFLLLPEESSSRMLPHFVSFATGALLGAALLALLPEAMEGVGPGGAHDVGVALVVGLGIFFVIEKVVLWRHAHSHEDAPAQGAEAGHHDHSHSQSSSSGGGLGHAHSDEQGARHADGDERGSGRGAGHAHGDEQNNGHGVGHGHSHGHGYDHGRDAAAGVLVLIGDSVHNVLDGVLIAAAFLTNRPLGLVTTFAVAAHEIPHRLGDFALLVHSGMSRQRALVLNMATGLAAVLGGIIAYFGLSRTRGMLPYALAVAAAGFLYIAVAGLIPALHRRADPKTSFTQVVLIGLGIGVIAWAESLVHE